MEGGVELPMCFLRDKYKRKSVYEGQRERERGHNGVKTERKSVG